MLEKGRAASTTTCMILTGVIMAHSESLKLLANTPFQLNIKNTKASEANLLLYCDNGKTPLI